MPVKIIPELGTNGALAELREQLKDQLKSGPYPGWFENWPQYEATARTLRWFEPVAVPGLLQTEDYARAMLGTQVMATPEEIEEMVAARIERQARGKRVRQRRTAWCRFSIQVIRRY